AARRGIGVHVRAVAFEHEIGRDVLLVAQVGGRAVGAIGKIHVVHPGDDVLEAELALGGEGIHAAVGLRGGDGVVRIVFLVGGAGEEIDGEDLAAVFVQRRDVVAAVFDAGIPTDDG